MSLEQMQVEHATKFDALVKDLEAQKAGSDAAVAQRSKLEEQLEENQQELQVGR